MWCKSRFSFLMQMLFDRDAIVIFMMQMSHWGYAMMQMPICKVCHDAKKILRCKWPLVGMSWCKCFDANTVYSKIPFIFKSRHPQCLKPKHISFSKYDLFFPTSHILFWLKVPKNWWSLLEISEWDINSKIWWSGSKDLFS